MALINLSGSISTTGTSILGAFDVSITTDADHTLSVTEYTNKFLNITSSLSLTATRKVIAPVVKGQEFTVINNTTGGQSITLVGVTGTGITIMPNDIVTVVCDGTNYLEPAASTTFAGDLTGTSISQTVTGVQTHPVATTAPVNSAVLVWDTNIYDIRQLTQDDILPGFAITSFSGGSTVETGATVTNPSFTASYNHTPNSANITNTDNINSPFNLISPFTSATIIGSFHHTSASSVTFTLTAIYSSTKTATQSINWQSRSFGGVGSSGATSATASGNNAVLSTSDTVNSLGLHSSDVGQVYGPFSPNGQKIYLVLPHTSTPHQVKDQNGFTFSFNSPVTFSFTNQNSAVISMDIYESTNLLSTPFTLTIVS